MLKSSKQPQSALASALTRRRLLLGGVALGAFALLPGCGGDDEESTATADTEPTPVANDDPTSTDAAAEPTATTAATAEPTATAAEDATEPNGSSGAFPVIIEHPLGETTIPAQPQRIVTTNDTEPLDCLLAMGVKPVLYGFTDGYGLGGLTPWVEAIGVSGVESFDNLERQVDLELIAAGQPDLILDTWTAKDVYQQMSAIAPTLVIKNDDNVPWQDVQRMVGLATGYEQAAEDAIADTEAIIPEQAARVAQFADLTVIIAYQFFDELLINGAQVAIGRLIEQLGLTVEAPDPANITFLSLEQWQSVDGPDLIISPEFFGEDIAKQEESPLFRSLPAVRNGHYVVLPVEVSQAAYLESTLSVRWVLPNLADAIIEAAEGRGRQLS